MAEDSNRLFVIFDCTEISTIDFSQVFETSEYTLRKSLDGTQTFVKYDPPQPSSVAALTTKSQEYTEEEIRNILTGSAWYPAT